MMAPDFIEGKPITAMFPRDEDSHQSARVADGDLLRPKPGDQKMGVYLEA
jgi:hypothetical protein